MRSFTISMLLLVALTFCACRKKSNLCVTVVKDCTGTYLRYDERDHPVCNKGMLEDIPSGTPVTASVKPAGKNNCADRNQPHCQMGHNYPVSKEWIIVMKVKS